MTDADNPGVCRHVWAFMPEVDDVRVTWHVCGRRTGHRMPHRCWACSAEDGTK